MPLDSQATGVLAALAAPFCMAIVFLVWDTTWKNSSAFSLNLFKCNLASIIFLICGFVFGFVLATSENGGLDKNDNDTLPAVGWLVLSGIIGIIIGDLFWLEALKRLGAFQVLVIDTIKPFCAAFLGRLILDELIHNVAYAGIVMTVLGVLMVSMEQNKKARTLLDATETTTNEESTTTAIIGNQQDEMTPTTTTTTTLTTTSSPFTEEDPTEADEKIQEKGDEEHRPGNSESSTDAAALENNDTVELDNTNKNNKSIWFRRNGYFLAIANVILDTYGSLLTKQHGTHFTTWTINLIRFGSSGLLMISISCGLSLWQQYYYDQDSSHEDATHDDIGDQQQQQSSEDKWYRLPSKPTKTWVQVSLGVLFVTFFCPALSNYALFQIPLALALTLTSITPLYALVLEWAFYGTKKRPTLPATVGATIAVGGVAILGIFNENKK